MKKKNKGQKGESTGHLGDPFSDLNAKQGCWKTNTGYLFTVQHQHISARKQVNTSLKMAILISQCINDMKLTT